MTTDVYELEQSINAKAGPTSLDWRIGKFEEFGRTRWWWICHGQLGTGDSIMDVLQQIDNLPL